MSDSSSTTHNPKIPTYLPLTEAAEKFGLSEKVLIQMIQAGKIEAVQLPSGELLVAAEKNGNGQGLRTKDEIISEKFAHLRKRPISASEAGRKYSKLYGVPISQRSFSRWCEAGHVTALSRGYKLELDEAEVAFCAEIYAQKYKEYGGRMSGVRIFDETGNPYRLKYPEVAQQLRIDRHLAREQLTEN